MDDIEVARQAKVRLLRILADDQRVAGVAIGGDDSTYRLEVNIIDKEDVPLIPRQIDGVPIDVVEVGEVVPYTAIGSPSDTPA